MTSARMSYQQLDPVGGYGIQPLTLLTTVITFAYAAGATAFGWDSVREPWLALTALVVSGTAALAMVFWSSPLRAPFSNLGFGMVLGLGTLAMLLAAAATWGGVPLGRADWGPVALGLGIVQLGPYRRSRQLAIATTIAVILVGVLAVLRPTTAGHPADSLVRIVESVVPLVALGFASTGYAASLERTMRGWRSTSAHATQAAIDQLRDGIVRSVQHDRVTILNLQVLPFFAKLLERGRVDARDSDRARSIAESIRSVMVAEVDRSWLDMVIDQSGGARADGFRPGSEMVQDDDRLAAEMATEQRTATRAFLVMLFEHPGFDPDGFGIVLGRQGASCVFTLAAKLDREDSLLRSGLAAYLAVLRIAFGDLQVNFQPPTLTLRFSYEHK